MNIGIDASVIFSSAGGTRVYALQLLSAMLDSRPDWTYFLYSRNREQADELQKLWSGPNVHPVVVAGSPNTWRLQAKMPGRLRRDRIDLYHSLGYFLPFAWPGPKVVTIHDLNVYLNWRSWARPNKALNWADMAFQIPLAARAADQILTDSEFSRDSIRRLLRVRAAKVTAIPLAPDPFFDQAPAETELDEARALSGGAPFLLFVGILAPQKNLGMLIRAFGASDLPKHGARLVLAGSDREGHAGELRTEAAAHGVGGQLVLPGFVSMPLLRALYHEAMAVVLPSLGEGFGLPAVEAMACGAPVLAANRQSLPEVVGDAGCLFDPGDVTTLARLLDRLQDDVAFRRDLSRRGRERRQRFSWTTTAEETAAIYEEVVSRRRYSSS